MKPEAEPLHYNIHIYIVIITQRAKVELSWRDPAHAGAKRGLKVAGLGSAAPASVMSIAAPRIEA
jgi:hypothetical protein